MDERRTAPQAVATAQAGVSVATARRIERDPRPPTERREPGHWRTRENPLALVWDEFIVPLPERAPGLKLVTVCHELDRAFPGAFGGKIRRTLRASDADWWAVHGLEREVILPQTHEPGRLGPSDFTDASAVGVTIGGTRLPHRLYHFAFAFGFSGFEHVEVVLGGASFAVPATGLQTPWPPAAARRSNTAPTASRQPSATSSPTRRRTARAATGRSAATTA